ncbi:MAG: YfhO family protein [Anaerolineae bacterium]|nr:YfhO family protein [Anaerolineae bacterium]
MIKKHYPKDLIAITGLCLLVLFAFWHIGPAGRVIAGGDLSAYFYPYWAEATRAMHAGRLPLWNPYLFMGVPLLANSQVGVFYPLNWPLWLLLPAHRSLHWSIVLHLALAAVGTYACARREVRLRALGAWTAGALVALGGYLGAQVEHVNQLQALAWFPWLILLYERAADRKTLKSALPTLAGLALVVGMVILAGHTQAAFIVLVGLAIYGMGPAAWGALRRREWTPLWRRAALWAGALALGGALAGVQLLPTFELTRLSMRAGGLPFNERVSFSLSPVYLARALLPGYTQAVEPENIEYVAAVGVAGLALLAVGLRAAWRQRRGLGALLLVGTGLFLALGLYNPVYLLLARFVPGFAHFRAPARWLTLWAFGAALLAGMGADWLARRAGGPPGAPKPSWRGWVAATVAAVIGLAWGALGGRVPPMAVAGWVAAAVLAAGLVWLAGRAPRAAAVGLVAVGVLELLVSARTLPHAQATAAQAYTSLRPAAAHLLAAGEGRTPPDRFLSLSALVFDPGDLDELRIIYGDQLSPAALYALIISAKHREVLSPNLPLAFGIPAVDGYDGGVLPLARYLALQRAFLPEDQFSPDGRLRENLTEVPDGRWLSLFGVRYVITDKVFDAWVDDVFYDLQFTARLAPGEAASVGHVPAFQADTLGLVTYLDGAAALPDGTSVGEVTVDFADGTARVFVLRAGEETAEGLYGPQVAHAQAVVGGHFWPGQPEGADYAARLQWGAAETPTSVTVRATLPEGRLVVRGVSLIDERTEAFLALTLSDRGRFYLAHSGDVKVYENLDVLGRAFVVHRAWAVEGEAGALARMTQAGFDPTHEIVVEGGAGLGVQPATPGTARILAYTAERVEIEASLSAPGYLVLTDAAYPGWRVWVDGAEADIATADLLFRAVQLEAGSHWVTFAFEPASVRVGAAISLLAWVLVMATGVTKMLRGVSTIERKT